MPDPIDELESFTMPSTQPLPPAEVRRRGDRIRRRNNALATVGGIAVVAAIVAPIAVLAGHDPASRSVPPAGQPTWHQTIPASFDVTAVPDQSPVRFRASDGSAIDDFHLCGTTSFSTSRNATDTAGASYGEAGTESSAARTVAVFPDEQTAARQVAGLRESVQSCPQYQVAGTDYVWNTVDASVPADDSLVLSSQVQLDPSTLSDLTLIEVARVGNAVFVGSTHTSAGGDRAVRETLPSLTSLSQPVVDQMCVFSATPCSGPTSAASADPGTGEGAVSAIPADFPIARGLTAPEGDPLIGPSSTSDGVPKIELCGRTVWPVQGVDRLAVAATGPEYLETRELVTFASTAELTTALDDIRRAADACADVTGSEAAPAGADDAVTFAVLPAHGLGGALYQFAQVGRALYATYAGGEWSADTVPAGVDDLTASTEKVLPDLCIWTEQGC